MPVAASSAKPMEFVDEPRCLDRRSMRGVSQLRALGMLAVSGVCDNAVVYYYANIASFCKLFEYWTISLELRYHTVPLKGDCDCIIAFCAFSRSAFLKSSRLDNLRRFTRLESNSMQRISDDIYSTVHNRVSEWVAPFVSVITSAKH